MSFRKDHSSHCVCANELQASLDREKALLLLAERYHDEHRTELHKTDTPERATVCPVCRDIGISRMTAHHQATSENKKATEGKL